MIHAKKVRQDCMYKVTKSFPSNRSYSCLSASHQIELNKILQMIEDWVYDQESGERLIFQIHSYSLKKAISK